MKRRMLLILALLCLPRLAAAEFPDKVTIGDKTIECRTVDEIRKLGFECEDIPWKDNAARIYIDAMNSYKAPSKELEDALSAATKTFDFGDHAEEARKFLEDNQGVLGLLKQADAMPKYEFPMHRAERFFEAMLPPLARFMFFSRLLDCKAAYDLSTGKSKQAVDESFMAFRLGRRVKNGTELITWLVGMAVELSAVRSLDRMTASGKLDEPALKDIAKRLEESGDLGDLTRPIRNERIFRMKVLEDLEHLPPEQRAEIFAHFGGKDVNVEEIQWDVIRRNLTEVFDFYDTLAKKPVLDALKGENSVQAFREKRQGDWDAMTRSLTPAYDRLFVTYGRRQVEFDVLRIRVALTRFKLAKGAYPKDLAAVVPTYLDKLPTDALSGNPYGYRLEADGNFLLWSVGEDLNDDGGEGDPNRRWNGPDYVFTSRPPEPPK